MNQDKGSAKTEENMIWFQEKGRIVRIVKTI